MIQKSTRLNYEPSLVQLEKEVAAGAKRAVALEADVARSPNPHISTPSSGLWARCVGVVFGGVGGFDGSFGIDVAAGMRGTALNGHVARSLARHPKSCL